MSAGDERLPEPRFELGEVVATVGAVLALKEAGQDPRELLIRHLNGDWGEVGQEDAQENEFSVDKHLRILSVYTLSTGVKLWVLTEADRSATTLLLAEEY